MVLEQIKNIEQNFKQNNYTGNNVYSCFIEKYGDIPVLISAPHSVKQIRNGKIKAHEFYTGSIAHCLAKQIGCSCIAKQYLIETSTNDDPNTDDKNCLYKKTVSNFLQNNKIKLFVDIHGLSSKRDCVVDVCIDSGKNINNMQYVFDLQKIINNKFGENSCSIDKYFQASSENVMSKWVYSTYKVSAIQLEINGAYRWFEGDTQNQSLDLFLCLEQWLKMYFK